VEDSGRARGGAAAALPRMSCRGCGSGVPRHERAVRGSDALAKAFAGILVGRDDDDVLGCCFPAGALSWSYNPAARGSLGENLVQILDEQRCRLWRLFLLGGVVSRDPARLEALLVQRSWATADGDCNSAAWRAEWVLPSPRGGVRSYGGGSHDCLLWLLVAYCSSWRCLAMVSAAWDYIEGRRLWHRHHVTT
jgi:hypothetical protein